jgi:hypothetical protein
LDRAFAPSREKRIFLQHPIYVPIRFMEQQQHKPHPPSTLLAVRLNGWTGEKMAIFCEALAETAVVAEACDQAGMGISGAYAARRRNPVFAAAWDAALSIARERLADTLDGGQCRADVQGRHARAHASHCEHWEHWEHSRPC